MDRSFRFFDTIRAYALIASSVLAAIATIANITIVHDVKFYCSTYATMLTLTINLVTPFAVELYSKWNSFIIASGTNRTDFINQRFIKLILINGLSAVVFTCFDFISVGVNNKTLVLMILNVSVSVIVTSIVLYVFCRLGATIRTEIQMILIAMPLLLVVMLSNALTTSPAYLDDVSIGSQIWALIVAIVIMVLCYIACRIRIQKVDM